MFVTWLESLAEEMVQAAIAIGKHCDRRVITHRTDSFLLILHHWMQDHFQLFQRETNGKLAAAECLALEQGGFGRIGLHDMVDLGDAPGPFAECLAGGEHVLYLVVAVEARGGQIDADGSAGPTRPFSMMVSAASFTMPVSEPTTIKPSEVMV